MAYVDMDLEVKLVTPAFISGVDRSVADCIRPPTLKALLRFWWRALHPDLTPSALFRQEAAIFGSTDRGQGLQVIPRSERPTTPVKRITYDPPGKAIDDEKPWALYMGYGATRLEARVLKLAVARAQAGESALFLLRIPSGREDEIRKALWLMSAFGGIGARSRRGWGSVRLHFDMGGLPDPHSAGTPQEAGDRLRAGLSSIFGGVVPAPRGGGPPAHTALSPDSRLALGPQDCEWPAAMRSAWQAFYQYRRALGAHYNHAPGAVGPDHTTRACWIEAAPVLPGNAPLGSAFGLPHNGFFRTAGAYVDVGVGRDLGGRRASPLFFKVLRVGAGYAPLALWLPATFLPTGAGYGLYMRSQVQVGGRRDNRYAPVAVGYAGDTAVKEFFDGSPGLMCHDTPGPWPGLLGLGWRAVL